MTISSTSGTWKHIKREKGSTGRVNVCPFTLVLPRLQSLSLFAFSAFSISGVLFPLQFQVSTVISVILMIPEDSD